MKHCNLCPRRCSVDRTAGEIGTCGVSDQIKVARSSLHPWEEPCISGTKGSGTIFFAGCALGCVFCQNHRISHDLVGQVLSTLELRGLMDDLSKQGAHNINLVTPTHYTPQILTALESPFPLPIVWNSSGYELPATLTGLQGKVNVFIPDYKYALVSPASMYSSAPDYPSVVLDAIETMIELVGKPILDAEGLLQSGVLVRHLILPGNLDNTRAVIDRFVEHFQGRALFSLMSQYVPMGNAAQFPKIHRTLTHQEYDRSLQYAYNCGITDCYIQDQSAADRSYIPDFDNTL